MNTKGPNRDDVLTDIMARRNCTEDEAREFIVTLRLVLRVSKRSNRLYKAFQRLRPALRDFEPDLYRKLLSALPGLYGVMGEIEEHSRRVVEDIAGPSRSAGT